MDVVAHRFLADQLFGLNGLVNIGNFAFLLALSVRNVLTLRLLSLASDVLILPYYYLQHEPLWPPLFWSVAFILVNGVQIVLLMLARRPVILNDREAELYRVAFDTIDKRDFLKLATLARWVDLPPGELIVRKGRQIAEAIILISGETEAVREGKPAFSYRPGQLIGNVSAYSGLVSPVDVRVRSAAKVATWDLEQMRAFTESRPDLRAKLLQMMSTDLAGKLNDSLQA